MIKHVIFDLGNVIVHIHPQRMVNEFTRRCNISEQDMKSLYYSDVYLGFMEGRLSPNQFFELVMKKFPCNLVLQDFKEIWNRLVGDTKEGIRDIVKNLKNNVTLSICSNTDPWHWQTALDRCSVLTEFDNFFLSFEMKKNKPDLRFFEEILQILHAKGQECVFIDDTARNIEAAIQCGITGIHTSKPKEMEIELRKLKLL